jgi:hypothetical protein
VLYVVTGPPAAGKSTWINNRAKHGDITIDFDRLAGALTPNGEGHKELPKPVLNTIFAARRAAIDTALSLSATTDVYIIHTRPDDNALFTYHTHGAKIIVVDPGEHIVRTRCQTERPQHLLKVVDDWYAWARRRERRAAPANRWVKPAW